MAKTHNVNLKKALAEIRQWPGARTEGTGIMKNTQTSNTPTIRIIDGIPFVRVIDLAHLWNTSTASILATSKPHHVPEEHIRRIDGRVWCSFAGLRYRLRAAKQGSQLTRHIREFLDAQAEKKPTAEPTPEPTDLGTAALIADARRTASQALAKAVETRQGGAAVQVTRLEQRQRFTLWSIAVMATVQVFAAIARIARR